MGFRYSDNNIYALCLPPPGILQHPVGLADAGCGSEIGGQPAPLLPMGKPQKAFCIGLGRGIGHGANPIIRLDGPAPD